MVKITKNRFRKALEGTRGNKTLLANAMNVTRQTVYTFIEKNPEVLKDIEIEAEKTQDLAEIKIEQKIKEGDMRAIELALVKHKRGRSRGYGERQEIEHSTALEGITINLITKSDEEIRNDK
jgi:DNA-binding XRE family transcriptional regulator